MAITRPNTDARHPSKATQRVALVRAVDRCEDPTDVEAVAKLYEEELADLTGWRPVLNRAQKRARIRAMLRRPTS